MCVDSLTNNLISLRLYTMSSQVTFLQLYSTYLHRSQPPPQQTMYAADNVCQASLVVSVNRCASSLQTSISSTTLKYCAPGAYKSMVSEVRRYKVFVRCAGACEGVLVLVKVC